MHWDLLCFCLATAAIGAGCLLPARWLPLLPHDKALHFAAFAGLTLLAAHIAGSWSRLPFWLLGLLLAGWAIELLQQWVPGRAFCWRDMGANAAGIAAATCCAPLLMP